jgi:hypothetical protein
MPDFDKIEEEAQQLAQKHPDQVKKGEERVENEVGLPDDQQQQSPPSQSDTSQ